jgi:hypothetical protein
MAFLIALTTVYGVTITPAGSANGGASPSATTGMPVEALADFGHVVKAGRFVSIGSADSAIGATLAFSCSGNSELTQ